MGKIFGILQLSTSWGNKLGHLIPLAPPWSEPGTSLERGDYGLKLSRGFTLKSIMHMAIGNGSHLGRHMGLPLRWCGYTFNMLEVLTKTVKRLLVLAL
jgi:hypothetical protein